MSNKIKDLVKSMFINASVAAFSLENKLTRNTDAENKSMSDGSIDVQKEHKNDVLNKLRRGEKHEEYTEYFYKLLDAADKVVIDNNLFEKYKDNFDLNENFDHESKDFYGNKTTYEGDRNELKKFFDNVPKSRERVKKFNEHYKFISDYKFQYDRGEGNIDFYPDVLTKNELKELNFVRFREFGENELIFEFWINKENIIIKDNYSIDEVILMTASYEQRTELNEKNFEDIKEFETFYLNNKFRYKINGFLIREVINDNVVLVFKGYNVNE